MQNVACLLWKRGLYPKKHVMPSHKAPSLGLLWIKLDLQACRLRQETAYSTQSFMLSRPACAHLLNGHVLRHLLLQLLLLLLKLQCFFLYLRHLSSRDFLLFAQLLELRARVPKTRCSVPHKSLGGRHNWWRVRRQTKGYFAWRMLFSSQAQRNKPFFAAAVSAAPPLQAWSSNPWPGHREITVKRFRYLKVWLLSQSH